MEEFDLYDDLISEKKSLDQAEEQKPEVDKLRKELKQSNEKLRTLRNKNFELKQKCDQLETNISSLIKTSRSEINRKNEIIASLRRELDQISFRRILKQRQGSSSEIRELTERLTDVLKNDSPSSKLSISDGVTNGVKPKNKSIKVTHFNTEDVYTIKLGNTSFTNVFSGRKEMPSLGFSNNDRNEILTVQQTIPDTLVQEPKLNDNGKMRDVPAVLSPTSEKKTPLKKSKSDEKCNERTSSNMKNRDQNRNNRDHYHSRSSRRSDRDSGETKRPSRSSSSRSHRGEKKSSERHSYKSSSSTKEMSKSNTESKRDKPDSSKDKYVKKSSKSPKKSITSSSSSTNDIQSSRIATGKKNSQTSLELTEMDILNTNQDTNDIDSLLEEKKRLLAKLEKEQRALLSEGGDEIIVKIDQNKKKICSQNEAASKGSDREEGECEDEDEIMDDQQKCHSKNQTVETTACQQGSERDILDTTPNKNEDSIDGIISTNDFLGNWPARSFTQYKTPPSKNNRNRTDSETSSHVDFSSAAGISSILKGKLVPGSYVSPRTGMIRTPTPTREKPNVPNNYLQEPPGVSEEHEVKLNRTRNKSREIAKELEGKRQHKENVDENLVNLGLDVSSTEDEKSPVKRNVQQQQQQKKKRKRPSLGFSNNDQSEVISHKRLKK